MGDQDQCGMAVTDDEPAELTVGAIRELVERLEELEAAQDEKSPRELDPQGVARQVLQLDKRLKNLEKVDVVTADRELDQPWGAGWPDSTPVELTLGALREIVGRLADLQETPEFLDKLRAAGVTRYKRGDLEIELGPRVPPEEGSAEWRASTPEQLQKHRDRIGCIRATECTCYVCQAERRQPHLAGIAPPDPPGSKRCPHCGELATLHYRGSECLGCERCQPGDGWRAGRDISDDAPAVEIDFAATERLLRDQDEKRRRASE